MRVRTGDIMMGAGVVALVGAAISVGGSGAGRWIVAGGERFDVGREVVLWTDSERGLNGYGHRCVGGGGGCCDVEGPRYGVRMGLAARTAKALRAVVTQVVLHHDGCTSSRSCFESMHNRPRPGGGCGLSAHFMIDADGTIYQTLDVVERAFHAEEVNNISI